MLLTTSVTVSLSEPKFLDKLAKALKGKYTKVNAGLLTSAIATIGAKNEYGGTFKVDNKWRQRGLAVGIDLPEEWTIPPRPFMHDTFNDNNKNWIKVLATKLKENKLNVDRSLGQVGDEMVKNIKETILDHNYRANHPITIEIKGSDHPLIDSGKMYDSIKKERE